MPLASARQKTEADWKRGKAGSHGYLRAEPGAERVIRQPRVLEGFTRAYPPTKGKRRGLLYPLRLDPPLPPKAPNEIEMYLSLT